MNAGHWWLLSIVLVLLAAGVLVSSRLNQESATRARAEVLARCAENCISSQPAWTMEECRLICESKVWIGMTPEQARASWGNPSRMSEVIVGAHVYEHWAYGGFGSLTFESGHLSNYESDVPDT